MDHERMLQMLTQKRIGYLCTAGSKNRPHLTPIFVIYDSKMHKIYFQANRTSKKIRDILANPKVSLSVDRRDVINPFKNEGVMVQGDAEVLETELKKAISEDLGIAFDVFMSKFADIVIKGEPGEKVVVRINIRKMVYWKGPKFQTIKI
jgi:nitroimidazol reductase NimA-like FMN-containing flavoprotein (pyridoxamine 5'-phosphate oxidase superfamily)